MRFREIICETINLTSYTLEVKTQIFKTAAPVLVSAAKLKPSLEDLKDQVDRGDLTELLNELHWYIVDQLEPKLVLVIKEISNKITSQGVDSVKFAILSKDEWARAENRDLKIHRDLLDFLAKEFINIAMNQVNPDNPQVFDQIFAAIQRPNNTAIKTRLLPVVNLMASQIVHELVHIVQHSSQTTKQDVDYRSYKEKKSGELKALSQKEKRTPEEDTRYDELYYASPQEITAFAHNIVHRLIDEDELDVTSSAQLPSINEYKSRIVEKVKTYFNPQSEQERAIFNRYLKQTFQIFDQYLDSRKSQ